jgi:hypothetical protein
MCHTPEWFSKKSLITEIEHERFAKNDWLSWFSRIEIHFVDSKTERMGFDIYFVSYIFSI